MDESKTFIRRYCDHLGLPEKNFANSLFWRSVHWYMAPMVAGVWLLRPKYFKPDIEFIRSIGACETLRDMRGEASSFHWECGNASFLRRKLRIRISTTRTLRIAKRLLGKQPSNPAVA